ncbi:MFS transporter [Frondihabitans cladoniiphilus]|uniref:Major facilitator superfamily (MFS) profile domain-containing protein n=1 Tax=Frondihabitans cladoniiphilus TaxID=715785 RepID=A0ABP8WB34_9MICO
MSEPTLPQTEPRATLREVFAGRRGRLLIALLLSEFGAAVQGLAYSTVLPVTAADLHGSALYGATLAAGSLSAVLVLSAGAGIVVRIRPAILLFGATGLYVVGVLLAALAPTMSFVLAGNIVRGIAAGLLAGFGLSAIGGLFDDRTRPRVFGLFAMVWILPSFLGPAANAAITLAFGWRWAVAWPVVIVVVARILVGRQADVIPWERAGERVRPLNGLIVVAGLVLASVGSGLVDAPSGTTRLTVAVALLALGLIVSIAGSLRVIATAARSRGRFALIATFFLLCGGFFGLEGLLTVAVIDGAGGSVAAGAVVLAAALVAWTLVALIPWNSWLSTPTRISAGCTVLVIGIAGEIAVQVVSTGQVAVVAAAAAALFAGAGMGLAYPALSSAAFDALAPARVAVVATAVAFGETAATSVGSLLGGGTYSLVSSGSGELTTRAGLVLSIALCGGAALGAVVLSRRTREASPAGATAAPSSA